MKWCLNFLCLGIISLFLGWMQRPSFHHNVQLETTPTYRNDSSLNSSTSDNRWVFEPILIWNFDCFSSGLLCNYWFPTCGGCVVYYPNQDHLFLKGVFPEWVNPDSLTNRIENVDSLAINKTVDSTQIVLSDSTVTSESRWDRWKRAWREKWARRREKQDLF